MSWRMKLAFLIAGDELYAWNSRHNRIVSKMMQGYTEERIIKLLEGLWQKAQGTDLPAVAVLPQAIALIKGEQK